MLIVVKIGTKIVLNEDIIDRIVAEISRLVSEGNKVVIVSSGAIGLGRRKLGINDNLTLSKKQALSSVGQVELMKLYQNLFSKHGLNVAQILLTYSELNSRKSILNLINTINELFKMNIIPVINENDAVAVEEIKFGNNDILASLVATTLQADKLVILTDVDGLFKNFGSPNQELVREIRDIREATKHLKGKKFELSTGGMKSKLQAGFTCMKSGVECIIANGFNNGILKDAINGIAGTKFIPDSKGRSFKDRLLILARKKGSIVVDNGAADAIRKKKSLLPVGIKEVKGKFSVGDPIFITDLNGNNIAIGITNYSSSEVNKIKGKRTHEIGEILGTTEFDEEVIHIDNMVIL